MIRAFAGTLVKAWANRPIELSWDGLERARFCFAGEFGYELISWLPYVHFLSRQAEVGVKTASRPGSALLYRFSADHCELQSEDIGDAWGYARTYWGLARRFRGERLIFPGPYCPNSKRIRVGGYDWEVRDIHTRVRPTNYLLPSYRTIATDLPFAPKGPMVIINNKYFVQWPDIFDAPVNYFSRDDLVALRDLLVTRGFFVVYNHFTEKTIHDKHSALDDERIFGADPCTVDMRDYYRSVDASTRNELQLALYTRSACVIGPQGGNLYLPAICGCNLIILMRHGILLDYLELARMCRTHVEAFYDASHLLLWLGTPASERALRERADGGGILTGNRVPEVAGEEP